MDPERLDGGEDFFLVASEGHAHPEQVSAEEQKYGKRLEPNEVRRRGSEFPGRRLAGAALTRC